jgi:ElaB/YqjD/DUF883 family membrane-anchored ribosome-binding protein
MKAALPVLLLVVPAYPAFVAPVQTKGTILAQIRTTAPVARIKSTPPKRTTFFGLGRSNALEKAEKKGSKKLFFSVFFSEPPEAPAPSFTEEVSSRLVTIGTSFIELQKLELQKNIATGKESLQNVPAELAQRAREVPGWAAEKAQTSATSAWAYTKASAEDKILDSQRRIEAAPEWVAASTQRAIEQAKKEVAATPGRLAVSAQRTMEHARKEVAATPGRLATSAQMTMEDAKKDVVATQDRVVSTTKQTLNDAKNYVEDAYCTVTGRCS